MTNSNIDLGTLTPQKLKESSYEDLKSTAEKIREEITSRVLAGSGHLGSNLGIVELTFALHRVYDSPKDKIIFDTGHQAYVHKIITGRYEQFKTLRLENGLSGYPSRAESDHDLIENSHASTSVSYAHGFATAYKGTDRKVVAVLGDGALTGGMAYEGLNNIGHSGADVVIVLNDNERSYAPTVSMLGNSLVKLRANRTFRKNEEKLARFMEEIPLIGKQVVKGVGSAKTAVREYFEPTSFFEDLGITYLGPFDGHDLKAVERALKTAKGLKGPTLVHVLTQKGKGYGPAVNDPIKNMHDIGAVKEGSFTQIFSDTLKEIMTENENVYAITAAMPDSTGLLPIQDEFKDRVIDVGIAEQHAVTFATGLAMGGKLPVVAVYSTFLTRAVDQVVYDAALHKQKVIFCLDRAGITGTDGPSHNGVFDMALFTSVPGITILAPASGKELAFMLKEATKSEIEGPIIIRWPKTAPSQLVPFFDGDISQSQCVNESKDSQVLLLGVGSIVPNCIDAMEKLRTEGITAECWNVRSVKPIDPRLIERILEVKNVVTVEDGIISGGFGQNLAAQLGTKSNVMIKVLGVADQFLEHADVDSLQQKVGINADGIASTVKETLK